MSTPSIELPPLKRGTTLSLRLTRNNANTGAPENLTGWSIRVQIRKADGTLVASSYGAELATLVVTIEDQVATPGVHTIVCPASDTATWPLDGLEFDVHYETPAGAVSASSTMVFNVVQGPTR